MKGLAKAILSLVFFSPLATHAKTAVDFLKVAPAPVFREGNTLLPLTRWGWPLTVEAEIELAQRWGYAISVYPGKTGEELDKPGSNASKLVAFNKANGNRYPVSVATRRPVLYELDMVQSLLSPQAWLRNADGSLILRDSRPVLKPYISDSDAVALGKLEIARLKRLRDLGVKVSVIQNAAEYMPGVPGNDWTTWRLDPEVDAWMTALQAAPAADRVHAYASNKAKQEQAVRDAVQSVMPESEVVYYGTGDVRRGRNTEDAHRPWAYPYRYMINGGTLPSWEFYYGYFGFWVPSDSSNDYLLLHATNGAAQAIDGNRPLSYNWLSAGWSLKNPALVSDDKRYMGFLKFVYGLGSVGNVAGYFTYPPEGFTGDVGETPPDWLRQIMLLSHAHAAFSHLEDFLRKGSLLPGNGPHAYSVDIYNRPSWPHPAYEFATNENSPSARVIARKLDEGDEWLIVAWAATGDNREVSAEIPGLGKVTLMARAEGSLYHAKSGPRLNLLDPVGMDPSRQIAAILESTRGAKPGAPTDVIVD